MKWVRKGVLPLVFFGILLGLQSAATAIPPTAVTDELDLGLVHEEVENSLPPLPDASDMADEKIDAALGGGCSAYAWPPQVSGAIISGTGEMNCGQPKEFISVRVQLQVRIARVWYNYGEAAYAEASGVNDVETTARNGCIDGTWRYRTKVRGAAGTHVNPDAQTDSDWAAARLPCDVLGAISATEFLRQQ